ncbi:hypothetical protein D3C76_257520 [compost metagenome]
MIFNAVNVLDKVSHRDLAAWLLRPFFFLLRRALLLRSEQTQLFAEVELQRRINTDKPFFIKNNILDLGVHDLHRQTAAEGDPAFSQNEIVKGKPKSVNREAWRTE